MTPVTISRQGFEERAAAQQPLLSKVDASAVVAGTYVTSKTQRPPRSRVPSSVSPSRCPLISVRRFSRR